MEKRKVWQILCSLTPSEQAHFIRWLWSEWGERQQYVQRLASFLVQAIPEPPERTALWAFLYPDAPYDDDRLRKLLRDLTAQLERFLATQALREEQDLMDQYLLKALEQRNLSDLLVKQLRKLERRWRGQPGHEAAHYRNRYLLDAFRQRHQAQFQAKLGGSPEHLTVNLDTWWLLERLSILLAHRFKRVPAESSPGLFSDQQLLGLMAERDRSQSPVILDTYEGLFQAMDAGTDLSDDARRAHILSLGEQIADWPEENAHNLLRSMVNFFVGEVNRQSQDEPRRRAAQLCLEILQVAFDRGALIVNGVLSWSTLRTVVNVALSLPDCARAEGMLAQLLPYVPQEEREEARVINQANIHFARENYGEVVHLLAPVGFSKPLYEVQARHTLMLCYYERREETEWLLGQIENNLRYTATQPIPQTVKEGTRNLLKLLRRLIKADRLSQLEALHKEAAELRPLSRGHWIQSRITRCLAQRAFYPAPELDRARS